MDAVVHNSRPTSSIESVEGVVLRRVKSEKDVGSVKDDELSYARDINSLLVCRQTTRRWARWVLTSWIETSSSQNGQH
jgi:hypothetical protein